MLVTSSFSHTCYDIESGRENIEVINSSSDLNAKIIDTALMQEKKINQGRVHSADAFYSENNDLSQYLNMECVAVEMESYSLFYNAKKALKKATTLLTISDNLITHEAIDSEAREKKLDEMIVLALDAIIKD